MLNVTIAKTAGFCFGVKRAVDMVYREAENERGPIFTLGPIIHNEQVVKDLEEKGVRVLSEEDVDRITSGEVSDSGVLPGEGSVIIRSHGVSRKVEEKLKASGLKIVDATCPFVRKIHDIVREKSREGRHILIIGDPRHPEVTGIRGWAEGPCDVVPDRETLLKLSIAKDEKITVVSQTTFNYDYFQELVEILDTLVYDIDVLNTICSATKERQMEAAALAAYSDVMLVVGSKSSSNTQKLYSICKAKCADTYYIQTLDDLVTVDFGSDSSVGITAGASAPNTIIQEVSQYVRGTQFPGAV